MAEFFFNLVPDRETVLSFFLIVVCSLVFIDGMLYVLAGAFILLGVMTHILLEVVRGIKYVINALMGRLPPREEEKKDKREEEKKDE